MYVCFFILTWPLYSRDVFEKSWVYRVYSSGDLQRDKKLVIVFVWVNRVNIDRIIYVVGVDINFSTKVRHKTMTIDIFVEYKNY